MMMGLKWVFKYKIYIYYFLTSNIFFDYWNYNLFDTIHNC